MSDIAPLAALPAHAAQARASASTPRPADAVAMPGDAHGAPAAHAVPSTPHALQRQLEALVEPSRTRLRFKVEEDLGQVAVSVIDERTGDVILQVPSETALRIARRLREHGRLLDERA
ncbi:MAG TPA: flagellar protein FlaG [Xanthomonadaceae bacterium]|nr:flagellar protein FlaG [Xanthomonadaceae bacterium]